MVKPIRRWAWQWGDGKLGEVTDTLRAAIQSRYGGTPFGGKPVRVTISIDPPKSAKKRKGKTHGK